MLTGFRLATHCCVLLCCGLIGGCDHADGDSGADRDADRNERRPRGPLDGLLHDGLCPADAGVSSACLEGCIEYCNALDDDCDGKIDEAAADESCVARYAESTCVDGQCGIVRCLPGHRDCDGQVGNGCEVSAEDARGCPQPGCDFGFADCDGDGSCESRLDTPEHCGSCEIGCPSTPNAEASCSYGACTPATCKPGYGDCDDDATNGCEQRLDSLVHCGGCGTDCSKTSCEGGVCSSLNCGEVSGSADCDGDQLDCEVDLTRDSMNCGECGNACRISSSSPHAQPSCTEGRCIATCESGYGDCDGDATNGCESRLDDVHSCGACGSVCALANVTEHSCEAAQCRVKICNNTHADCDGDAANGCERDIRSLAAGGMGPCLPDAQCERVVQDANEFFVCPTPRSWPDARAQCKSQWLGDLAHVPDVATRDFIKHKLRTRTWIGHTDQLNEGVWIWAYNQVPFWRGSQGGVALDGQFAEWSPGEPNASGDCGAMFATGLLDDLTCTRAQPFVCETIRDGCPDDSDKIDPGQCGCGRPDPDSNRDGFAECSAL